MKKTGELLKTKTARRVVSAIMSLVLLLGMLPASIPTARAANWVDQYIDKVVDWGVMRGDNSGDLNANKTITRAEFVAMVNRAFGYSAATTHPFTDVRTKDWFNNDIGIAYNMGYFKGTSETTASPNSPLTREQAVVLIGRNLLLDEKLGETLGFSDSRKFSEWSRGMVESAISAGFIGGYDDGTFQPQKNVTRGEVAAMLVKAIGTMVNTSGTHSLGGVYGNVMISTSGVKLKNTTIAGNLYITGGLDLGDVLLENVEVLGKIIVSGAGESHKGDSSIILRNVETGELVVDSLMNQFVTLRAEGDTQIGFTNVKTSAFMDDQTDVGDGLLYIEMNGAAGMTLTLAGNIEEVLNCTPGSILTVAKGTAQKVTVDEKAVGSTLDIKNIGAVEELNLDVGTPVIGEGDVKDIFINAADSSVEMLPDKITIRPGLTADVNGEEMDTKEGEESSAEPRILAGYPKIKNIAPSSAEAVFSTNKKGTIYWALTSLIDGPVSVEDLLETKDYNTKILQQGTIAVTSSNQEFKIKISKLISDGSYYVSAVLVDSRDQKSPVKYITFTTPDGTAPAFANGYPELTEITMDNAQVAVMPTKTSKLYYAVLPKGASAPTIAEFKTGAISGDLGNCPKSGIEVTKNVIEFEHIAREGYPLKELVSYELYLCLIDPDNGKDSGVKKISFTTVDGTPPVLNDAMVTGIQKTSINLTTSMNEAGTIYWVAVKEGQKYPVPVSGATESPALNTKEAILQVVNGMGNVVKAGKATAKANADVVLKITGLQGESGYDIYYVAQDKAGNYSVEVKKISEKTLDAVAPTARQEFTKTADAAGSSPLPETDVKIIFSESVRHKDGLAGSSTDETKSDAFYHQYEEYRKMDPDSSDAKTALAALVHQLEKAIQLWDVSNASSTYVVEHNAKASGTGTWINYEKVEMEMLDNGELVVTFKHGEAISLSSGGSYQIVLEDVTDTSNTRNPMKPNPYKLDPFTTVFAQVNLTSRASGNVNVGGLPVERGIAGAGEADVDMRFWMNPQSTDSVNSNVYYDVWFEAEDIIIYFDLYCRVIDPSIQNVPDQDKVIRDASKISMFGDKIDGTNRDFDAYGWIYLGHMDIRASGGTARSSVNSLINGKNTTKVSQLDSLDDQYTYEFIIDVTTINDSNNEKSWSEDVEIKVLVPAGQDLSGTDYAKRNPWTNDVTNIGNPDDFSISRKFIDTETPKFRDGYPTFAAGDTMVNMNIMLDRAGTFYYVVAPLVDNGAGGLTPSVATTVEATDTGKQTDFGTVVYTGAMNPGDPLGTATGGWFKWASADGSILGTPPSSGAYLDSKNPLGTDYKLVAPTKDSVALMVDKGVGIEDIKAAQKKIGITRQTIKVEELKPETTYLVYCILTGESQEYSEVYMFQFTTQQVDTPTIELNHLGGNTVQATTDTTAYLNWALYTNTTAEKVFGTSLNKFEKYLKDTSEPGVTAFKNACKTVTSKNPSTLTVLDALTLSMSNKQSIFDAFANDFIKDYVLQRVRMEASTYDQPTDMRQDEEFEANVPEVIEPGNMSDDVTYYIIAAACNTMGTTFGFKAQGGLHLTDKTPPTLREPTTFLDGRVAKILADPNDPDAAAIYNVLLTDALKTNPSKYMYTGSVEIPFSERIYQLLVEAGSIESELVTITANNFESKINWTGLKMNEGDKPYITVNGGTITIKFTDAQIGSSITIFKEGSICDGSQNVLSQGARLRLTLTTMKTDDGYVKPWFKVEWIKDVD